LATGLDILVQPNQAIPDKDLIDRMLAMASGTDPETGGKVLTNSDVAKFSHIRRSESKASNPQYMLDNAHKIFGSNKSVSLLLDAVIQDLLF
jgi:hypothetical protein